MNGLTVDRTHLVLVKWQASTTKKRLTNSQEDNLVEAGIKPKTSRSRGCSASIREHLYSSKPRSLACLLLIKAAFKYIVSNKSQKKLFRNPMTLNQCTEEIKPDKQNKKFTSVNFLVVFLQSLSRELSF